MAPRSNKHGRLAPTIAPPLQWYGVCPGCARETRKVTAHVVSGKSRKLPMCSECRALYPEATQFSKK